MAAANHDNDNNNDGNNDGNNNGNNESAVAEGLEVEEKTGGLRCLQMTTKMRPRTITTTPTPRQHDNQIDDRERAERGRR